MKGREGGGGEVEVCEEKGRWVRGEDESSGV